MQILIVKNAQRKPAPLTVSYFLTQRGCLCCTCKGFFSSAILHLWCGAFTNKKDGVSHQCPPAVAGQRHNSTDFRVWGLSSKTSILWGVEEDLLGMTTHRRRP